MSSRRNFIKQGFMAATAIGTLSVFDTKGLTIASSVEVKKYPIVISTWDFGIAANKAAWEILSKGGKALDAVEQGVRVPEADLKNMTVGKGGYPDRDGHVTLDACIMDADGNCGAVAGMEKNWSSDLRGPSGDGENTACHACW